MRRERSRVREESHLEDMRAAIRGDFRRLEERRGDQVLLRPEAPSTAAEEVPAPAAETVTAGDEPEAAVGPPEPDPEPEREIELAEPVPDTASEPAEAEPEAEDAVAEPEPKRRSWLDRLLGR